MELIELYEESKKIEEVQKALAKLYGFALRYTYEQELAKGQKLLAAVEEATAPVSLFIIDHKILIEDQIKDAEEDEFKGAV